MNKIEEMKKARDEFQRINGMILDLSLRNGTGLTLQAQNVHNQFMGSVDDLLSRLVIATKALEGIEDMAGEEFAEKTKERASKALQQIRE